MQNWKSKRKRINQSNQINRVSAWNSSNTKGSRSLFFCVRLQRELDGRGSGGGQMAKAFELGGEPGEGAKPTNRQTAKEAWSNQLTTVRQHQTGTTGDDGVEEAALAWLV